MASIDSSLTALQVFNHAFFSRLLWEALAYPYRLLISLWTPLWKSHKLSISQYLFNSFQSIFLSSQVPNRFLVSTFTISKALTRSHRLSMASSELHQTPPSPRPPKHGLVLTCCSVNDLYGFWSSSCSKFHCNPYPRMSSPDAPTHSLPPKSWQPSQLFDGVRFGLVWSGPKAVPLSS